MRRICGTAKWHFTIKELRNGFEFRASVQPRAIGHAIGGNARSRSNGRVINIALASEARDGAGCFSFARLRRVAKAAPPSTPICISLRVSLRG